MFLLNNAFNSYLVSSLTINYIPFNRTKIYLFKRNIMRSPIGKPQSSMLTPFLFKGLLHSRMDIFSPSQVNSLNFSLYKTYYLSNMKNTPNKLKYLYYSMFKTKYTDSQILEIINEANRLTDVKGFDPTHIAALNLNLENIYNPILKSDLIAFVDSTKPKFSGKLSDVSFLDGLTEFLTAYFINGILHSNGSNLKIVINNTNSSLTIYNGTAQSNPDYIGLDNSICTLTPLYLLDCKFKPKQSFDHTPESAHIVISAQPFDNVARIAYYDKVINKLRYYRENPKSEFINDDVEILDLDNKVLKIDQVMKQIENLNSTCSNNTEFLNKVNVLLLDLNPILAPLNVQFGVIVSYDDIKATALQVGGNLFLDSSLHVIDREVNDSFESLSYTSSKQLENMWRNGSMSTKGFKALALDKLSEQGVPTLEKLSLAKPPTLYDGILDNNSNN